MVLLFIDLLGTRSRWLLGGRSSVEKAFSLLNHLVAEAICTEQSETIKDGIVEADSVVILCESVDVALRIAQRLYQAVFVLPKKKLANASNRFWLRGTIIPISDGIKLRTFSRLSPHMDQIRRCSYAVELLEAISIEKSGFKGMRLLVDRTLLTNATRSLFSITVGNCSFVPFQKLRHSSYQNRIAEGFQDYLWMVTADSETFESLQQQMATRLRWAANNAEEFMQAAATQVVFHECQAMISGLHSKSWQKHERRK